MSVIVRTRINSRPAPFGFVWGGLGHSPTFSSASLLAVRRAFEPRPPRSQPTGGTRGHAPQHAVGCTSGTSAFLLTLCAVSVGPPVSAASAGPCSPGAARGRQLGGHWLQTSRGGSGASTPSKLHVRVVAPSPRLRRRARCTTFTSAPAAHATSPPALALDRRVATCRRSGSPSKACNVRLDCVLRQLTYTPLLAPLAPARVSDTPHWLWRTDRVGC